MITPLLVLAILVLDAIIGDPRWLWDRVPHPVVLMGRFIKLLDSGLNHGHGRRAKGVTALVLVILVTGAISIVPWFLTYGWLLEVLFGAILIAHRSLIQHVAAVGDGLRKSLSAGREAVSQIVGRDPETLDEAGVARAAIESAAENFSDGVIAPAFWFAIGGLPGIAIYKAINTADSMIGHRTERHEEFGWAAARLDDLLNLVPARLTGALLCLSGGGVKAARVMVRDAPLHRSPNAGWPEAAMAASIGVALAGPRSYAGVGTVNDAIMNAEGRREATATDIDAGIIYLTRAWVICLCASVLIGSLLV